MDSNLPPESDVYKLEKMTIRFTKSNLKFVLEKSCGNYDNDDFDVEFTCDGRYMYGNTDILPKFTTVYLKSTLLLRSISKYRLTNLKFDIAPLDVTCEDQCDILRFLQQNLKILKLLHCLYFYVRRMGR